ncbi:MAG: TIGR00269 family protein [Euryarchaeota archaeon]|nr:TIGR00269 family protein [Euryarchaeota archaeon]
MPRCSQCREPAVIFVRYSGRHLCARHFCGFLEQRVAKEVRSMGKLPRGSKMACAVSGGKDSTVMLHLMRGLLHPRGGVELEAIIVDEGIRGYRAGGIAVAKRECRRLGVPLTVVKFKELAGCTLDQAARRMPGTIPCAVCGVWRRQALNRAAKEMGASRLALGHNLNDVAGSVLMNVCRADVERLARMAPHGKVQPGLVPRMLPLRWIPEEEVKLYSYIKGLNVLEAECPYAERAERGKFVRFLAGMEDARPGTRHSVLGFWEGVRECVQASRPPASLKECPRCGEPTVSRLCKGCELTAQYIHARGDGRTALPGKGRRKAR